MSGWDSYRAVYGAELRAAAREFGDHGWPVIAHGASSLAVVTGTALDILEVPAAIGRALCTALRDAGQVVPVAATPTGSWYYPIAAGATLPRELAEADGVVLRTAGATVLMPPSTVPDGWVHWRVAPARCGYALAAAPMLIDVAVEAVRRRAHVTSGPGAQRPAGVVAVG